MLYNTGDIDTPDETNSIFKPEDAKKYLKGAPASYPLPLDVALPAFSWTLVFRDGELWKILPGAMTVCRRAHWNAGHSERALSSPRGFSEAGGCFSRITQRIGAAGGRRSPRR
jgi:hypothetical protein